MEAVVPFVVWLSVILSPTGDFTGAKLVVDNQAECQANVEYARNQVPEGFIVTDCVRLSYAPSVDRHEVQTP